MKSRFQIIALLGLLAWTVPGSAQNLSLPDYVGRPGGFGVLPLAIDDATGLAGLRATVNFDPGLLELVDVRRGSLGEVFDLVWQEEDGVLELFFAREDAVVSGNGRLAHLIFRVNAGARTNLFSDLPLADFDLSDESGTVSIGRLAAVAGRRGRVTVTDAVQIDNSGNGLPDEWELAVGLDPFEATADGDADGDGLSNGQEAQLGLDPTCVDTDGDGYDDRSEQIAGTGAADGNDFLALAPSPDAAGFGRPVFAWRSATGRIYSVRSATNLLAWDAVPLLVVSGDGAEMAFTNALPLDSQLYYRLEVERE